MELIVYDFDGVMTNNLVHFDQDGKEWVSCSRADGLAFDVLRKLGTPAYILSTEKTMVCFPTTKIFSVVSTSFYSITWVKSNFSILAFEV